MKKVFIILINFYQRFISPIFKSIGVNCKFYPSCSEYMKQAIEKYGIIKGTAMGIIRICRCNSFSNGGYDVSVYPTKSQEQTEEYVYKHAEEYDLVVCAGGDGTLDNTVGGIMKLERKLKKRILVIYGD